uniref:Uncharacterized protein n=1 Tax=Manihot esculenta TaxID=3983 RepID=A0A2C9U2S6_MANES
MGTYKSDLNLASIGHGLIGRWACFYWTWSSSRYYCGPSCRRYYKTI